MKAFYENDANPDALKGKTIAVMGYGSQGRAHALNLRDSGYDVVVGLRPNGQTSAKARADGFTVMAPKEAAEKAQFIAVLVPDMAQKEFYETAIKPGLKAGDTLLFAHGFAVHFGHITPPEDVNLVLIAPKGPGNLVRREYETGGGVPCLLAVEHDATGDAHAQALAYAHGLGGTRSAVIETSFKEETETDLFGEQAVLCGGAMELVKAGFETLTEAGYQPEVAYFECLHELKLIVDLFYEGGLTRMHDFVSDTANYGALVSGPRVVDAHAKAQMKAVLTDIQNGNFAKNWQAEHETGNAHFQAMMQRNMSHPLEATGEKLRAHMAWLEAPQTSKPKAA